MSMPDVGEWISSKSLLLSLVLVVIATVRIGLTWTIFHHTFDEPAHVATGMEWLEAGTYRLETQHPPLSRVAAALGARAAGGHYRADFPVIENGNIGIWYRGLDILFMGDHYTRTLACMRAAMLPFFWLACAAVYLWGRLLHSGAGACLSVLLFTMMPFVLAHSGLATTDMALTATFALAAYALVRLMQTPDSRRALFFGIAVGLMLLSKFSALPFFGASAILALCVCVWQRRKFGPIRIVPRLAWLGFSSLVAFLIVWMMYRFSFGSAPLVPFRVPFPEWFDGLNFVLEHNARGHYAYFMGAIGGGGWPLFFPVLFLVKTPLGILALFMLSMFIPQPDSKYRWLAWSVVVGIFATSIPSRINIGMRHILPVLPFVAVLAAGAGLALWERARSQRWAGYTLALFLVSTMTGSLWAHPDYLPDFNLLAGLHPENIAVDSDFDWGQDNLRLAKRLRELHAPSVAYATPVITDLARLGFPPVTPLSPYTPSAGWNAVGLAWLKEYRMGVTTAAAQVPLWPERIPAREIVGKTILLYYFTPDLQPGTPPVLLSPDRQGGVRDN